MERAILLDGLDVTFLDTAGEGGTDDPTRGRWRSAWTSLVDEADLVLVVVPTDRAITPSCSDLDSRTQALSRLIVGSFQ